MIEHWQRAISRGSNGLEVSFTELAVAQIVHYLSLLSQANQRDNLTSVPECKWVERHILDSIGVVPILNRAMSAGTDETSGTLIDVGSQAGLPGLPIAITCPNLQVTLLESREKRFSFLERVKREVGLKNLAILNGRAEEIGRNSDYRETFDFAVARALAQPSRSLELLLPLVRPPRASDLLRISQEVSPTLSDHLAGTPESAVQAKTKNFAEIATRLGLVALFVGGQFEIDSALQIEAELYGGQLLLSEHSPTNRFLLAKKVKPTDERYPRRRLK